jgi:hypothetical protein
MWTDRAASRALFAIAVASAWPRAARADEPPALPPVESAEERPTHVEIEPPRSRPPWSGREAIWGGVGLIVAGTATLIIVAPTVCSRFSSASPTPALTCYEATLGGGGGGIALGIILLAVGETQRSAYKEWLRTHPMFGGFSVVPSSRGPALGWSLSF